jgi:hypothetical protein
VIRLSTAHHPDGNEPGTLKLTGALGIGGLAETFNEIVNIEAQVDDFRAELDKLFPSTQARGKEEGDEPS